MYGGIDVDMFLDRTPNLRLNQILSKIRAVISDDYSELLFIM